MQESFFSNSALREHLLTHEPNYKWKYHCDVCKSGFKYKDSLKMHLLIHEVESNFELISATLETILEGTR